MSEDPKKTIVTVRQLREHLGKYNDDLHVHLTAADHGEHGVSVDGVCLDVALMHIRGEPKGRSI